MRTSQLFSTGCWTSLQPRSGAPDLEDSYEAADLQSILESQRLGSNLGNECLSNKVDELASETEAKDQEGKSSFLHVHGCGLMPEAVV